MLPKIQNAVIVLFMIFFINTGLVAYSIVDKHLSLGVIPEMHANTLGIITGIIALFGIIGIYIKSKEF